MTLEQFDWVESMKGYRPPKLFLGIGNILHRDDGFGVRAAELMAELPLHGRVEVVDGGTLGRELVDVIERRELVVVADSIEAGAEPGTVFCLSPEKLEPLLPFELSLHDAHFLDALDEVRLIGAPPREVVVFAVQVENVSMGIGLSPPVEESLNQVVALALERFGLSGSLLEQRLVRASDWTS